MKSTRNSNDGCKDSHNKKSSSTQKEPKKKNKPTMSREERERNKLLRSAYKRLKEHDTNKHRSKWV